MDRAAHLAPGLSQDQLAQEIALTISSDANAPLVRSTLIPMMLGPRRARRPDRRQ